ncbi:RNA polymerase sigma factor [Candidatus Poribacteria bacterium]
MSFDNIVKLDIDRFETMVLAHIDSIYRFALYMVHDDEKAQSLMLYTYLRACKSLETFDDRTSCRIWLLAILNDAIANTSPILPEARGRDNQDSASVAMRGLSEVRFGEVAAAIGELSALDRAIILLSDMEWLSHEEIANIVGCSIGNVSFRLFRGRMFLSKRLKAYLSDSVEPRTRKFGKAKR